MNEPGSVVTKLMVLLLLSGLGCVGNPGLRLADGDGVDATAVEVVEDDLRDTPDTSPTLDSVTSKPDSDDCEEALLVDNIISPVDSNSGEKVSPPECEIDADCDDGDPATNDICQEAKCAFVETGGPCSEDSDCVDSNPCTDESCDGENCSYGPVDVPACHCVTDADCVGKGATCGLVQLGPTQIVTLCTNPVGSKAGGAACQEDEECKSGMCMQFSDGAPICFGGCQTDADCVEDAVCGAISVNIPALGDYISIPACVHAPVECNGDGDCPQDQVCLPVRNEEVPGTLSTVCGGAQGGTKTAGQICAVDEECESGICFELLEKGISICWSTCQADDDCPVGLFCYESIVYFVLDHDTPDESDDTYYGLPMCAPYLGSFQACWADSDCPEDEFCNIYSNQTLTALAPKCLTQFSGGTAKAGQPCSADEECVSDACVGGGLDSFCLGLCKSTADCYVPTTCQTYDQWQLSDAGTTTSADICLP